MSLILRVLKIIGLVALTGCAGPATPLGAIWDLHPQNDEVAGFTAAVLPGNEIKGADPKIHFDPPRQILHGPHALKVIIDDSHGVLDNYGLQVRYHGHDVTRSFLMQARVSRVEQGSRLLIEVPSVRLSPATEHLIEVGYSSPDSGRHAYSRLRGPVCRAFESREIQNFDGFRPDAELTQAIAAISLQMGFNPAFTAALIAQESAFNPQSVSLSRALGLTQVTPLAEEEVTGIFTRWPRYPGLNELPAALVKFLVLNGEVNAGNEWRLNPERSIRGGLAFAKMLADRWQDSESFSKVNWTGGPGSPSVDAEVARTKLILASYNSGYARVVHAINRYGAAWLTAPELKEARKYVNRVFSFCDAFERVDGTTGSSRRPASRRLQWPQRPGAFSPALSKRVMHENET